MLARTFVRSLGRSKMQIQSAVAMTQSRRNFGEALTIPTDREQQAGRRKEELDAEAAGQIGFNRDPIVPASDAGSKENPILVPSGAHSRVVGYEDPVSHQLVWFNLNAGSLHFIPDTGLYFKLKKI